MRSSYKDHGKVAAESQITSFLATCVLIICSAILTFRYNASAAFERPIHFSIFTLLGAGFLTLLCCRQQNGHGQAFFTWPNVRHKTPFDPSPTASLTSTWAYWAQTQAIAIHGAASTSPLSLPVLAIVVRVVLGWAVVRTDHCSVAGIQAFLPALISLCPPPATRKLQLGHVEARPRTWTAYIPDWRYTILALIWAAASRASSTTTYPTTGVICPSGPLRYETYIPLAQAVGIVLDAYLIAQFALRENQHGDIARPWQFAARLFLHATVVLCLLACTSLYSLSNLRWAFVLDTVAFRDLMLDSLLAAVALVLVMYLLADLGPRTVALIIASTVIYSGRPAMPETSTIETLPTMGAVIVAVAGLGVLLHFDKDVASDEGPSKKGEGRLPKVLGGGYIVLVVLLGAWNVLTWPQASLQQARPLSDLIRAAQAQSDEWMTMANRSQSLSDAVEEYQLRYKIPPPPNFDKWYQYAMLHDSPIVDEFNQISQDLELFWGILPKTLRERTSHMLSYPWLGIGGIRIRDGKAESIPGAPGSHQWMLTAMVDMVQPFAHHLPDLDFAINLNDEPRVAVPFERIEGLVGDGRLEKERLMAKPALRAFSPGSEARWFDGHLHDPSEHTPFFEFITRTQIYYDYVAPGCSPESPARNTRWWSRRDVCLWCSEPHTVGSSDTTNGVAYDWFSATDLCHQPDLAYLHGWALSPACALPTTLEFPIFSQGKTSGFNDILMPSTWNFADKVVYNEEEDTETWGEKNNTLFWRGAASDGYAAHGSWQSFLRARFVAASRRVADGLSSLQDGEEQGGQATDPLRVDVGFVGDFQRCHEQDCVSEVEYFSPLKEAVDFSAHWRNRHLIDLDGAGFSGRFLPFLQSRSLVYRSGIFRTWMEERVHAWRHYVPVDTRLRELWDLVRFFGGQDPGAALAEQVATEGRAWAHRALRKEDMRIYMFRLLLEWGRLVDDDREHVGFES